MCALVTGVQTCALPICGKPWTGVPLGDNSAFTLSPAQARDVDLILRAGYLSDCAPDRYNGEVEPDEMLFWHPDAPDADLTRAEVLALKIGRASCRERGGQYV